MGYRLPPDGKPKALFRGRKNIGPDIREFFGRRTRRGVNPSFLMQRYYTRFCLSDLMQSSAKFVQTESSEKLAYSLPRHRRTKGGEATKVRANERDVSLLTNRSASAAELKGRSH